MLLACTVSVVFLFLPLNPELPEQLAEERTGITALDYFDPNTYIMNPGDEVWISFPGGLPFSGEGEAVSIIYLTVALDGTMNVPVMPLFDAKGMTLHEFQNRIARFFFDNYRGMNVSSGLARPASFQLPITGQVRNPGFVVVNGLFRLSEALELAGGTVPAAALSRVMLIDMAGDTTLCDLNRFLTSGDMAANPLLLRNTRIHVPSSSATILVEGAINSEEGHVLTEYIPGESAVEAVERVGGVSRVAAIDGCYVERHVVNSPQTEKTPFSLSDTLSRVLLQPGDVVVVPSFSGFINVSGEVVQPMPVEYVAGMTVGYYIGMAGGFTPDARRNSVKIVGKTGERTDAEFADVVSSGATIEVPRVPVRFWQDYLTILTGLATVAIAYHSALN